MSEDKVLDQERKIEWIIAPKGMDESVTRNSICLHLRFVSEDKVLDLKLERHSKTHLQTNYGD